MFFFAELLCILEIVLFSATLIIRWKCDFKCCSNVVGLF